MRKFMILKAASLLFAAGLIGGCTGTTAPPPQAAAPAPVDHAMQGFVASPQVAALGERERRNAGEAQYKAVSEGQRQSWRDAGGSFGFIEPGAEAPGAEGVCRSYTHTIYLNGRPVRGEGRACRSANGVWRIIS